MTQTGSAFVQFPLPFNCAMLNETTSNKRVIFQYKSCNRNINITYLSHYEPWAHSQWAGLSNVSYSL